MHVNCWHFIDSIYHQIAKEISYFHWESAAWVQGLAFVTVDIIDVFLLTRLRNYCFQTNVGRQNQI